MKNNKAKVVKNFEYKEHGLGCSKCMHYVEAESDSESRNTCFFLYRQYLKEYRSHLDIIIDVGAILMCENVIKRVTKSKKLERLLNARQLLTMNTNKSCPFHSLIEDRFKDTTVEVRS